MRLLAVAMLLFVGAFALPARADTAGEVRRLYLDFATAQNARDLERVASLLLDSPRFLWVSDGKSIWGREATIKRMALFQENETWRVEPDLDKAVVVEIAPQAAYFHLSLDLLIGPAGVPPERLGFLVSVLCVETEAGWRIAALFTTTRNAKTGEAD